MLVSRFLFHLQLLDCKAYFDLTAFRLFDVNSLKKKKAHEKNVDYQEKGNKLNVPGDMERHGSG